MLLAAGTLAQAAAPFLTWSQAGSLAGQETLWARSAPAAVAVLLCGPVASVAMAGYLRARPEWGGAGLAVIAAGVATLVSWVQLAGLPGGVIGPAGPVAVLAGFALMLAWALLAGSGEQRPALRGAAPGWAAGAVVLALLVAAAVPAVDWYRSGRFLQHATAAGLPETGPVVPADLTREQWQIPAPDAQLVGTTGRYAVLGVYPRADPEARQPTGAGARVVDAVTGQEHWHYLRTDMRALRRAALSGDGELVLLLFRSRGGYTLVALATATGEERWQQVFPEDLRVLDSHTVEFLPAQGVLVLTTTCGPVDRYRARTDWVRRCAAEDGELLALDPGTGAQRWRWEPGERDGVPCFGMAAAVAGGSVVVHQECPTEVDPADHAFAGPAQVELVGVSAADGTERWRALLPEPFDGLFAPPTHERPTDLGWMRGYGDSGVLVHLGGPFEGTDGTVTEAPPQWLLVDADDGSVRSRFATADEVMWAGDDQVILREGSEMVAVDPFTGTEQWRSSLPRSPGQRARLGTNLAVAGQTGYLLWFSGDYHFDNRLPVRAEAEVLAIQWETGDVTVVASYGELARLECRYDYCVDLAGGSLVLVGAGSPDAPGELRAYG